MRILFWPILLFTGTLLAQSVPIPPLAADEALPAAAPPAAIRPVWPPAQVVHAAGADGAHFALGHGYKAVFTRDGFAYVPFFGSEAARTWPVQFRIVGASVGGRPIDVAGAVTPVRRGDRIEYDRGAVVESYTLTTRHVEQGFVVFAGDGGDVRIELKVTTDLVPQQADAALRFVGEAGRVDYGEAFLLRDGARLPIQREWRDGNIVLHVPAAMRGDGPVVIDPLITTSSVTWGGGAPILQNANPDFAYESRHHVWLVAWESVFAQNDRDVLYQFIDGGGLPYQVNSGAIDLSTADCLTPRVANVHDVDRFVVAFVRRTLGVYQGRPLVWATSISATSYGGQSPHVLVSDPQRLGSIGSLGIGSHAGSVGVPGSCLVVWEHGPNLNDRDIRGQRLDGFGNPLHAGELLLADYVGQALSQPVVTRSTGTDVGSPEWHVVFTRRWTASDHDLHGCAVQPDGTVGSIYHVDNGPDDDRDPQISSPARAEIGQAPIRLVTFYRYNRNEPRWAAVGSGPVPVQGVLGWGFHDGERAVDSDGVRFLLLGRNAGATRVVTCAFASGTLWLHEGPEFVSSSTHAWRVLATRSGLGPRADYGILGVDQSSSVSTTMLVRWQGRASWSMPYMVSTGCDNLGLGWSGVPVLGGTTTLSVLGYGGDLPGLLFGAPAVAPTPICPTCLLGLRPDAGIATFLGADQLVLQIPGDVSFLGLWFGAQAVALGSGTCLGLLRVSDTLVFEPL